VENLNRTNSTNIKTHNEIPIKSQCHKIYGYGVDNKNTENILLHIQEIHYMDTKNLPKMSTKMV
jgi:hypothetical protein